MNNKKYNLINNSIELQKLKFSVDDVNIYMWRDDTIDFAFGGNKVRLYEYILPEILSNGCTKIATMGSAYSNHNRVTAAIASMFNLQCDIIVVSDDLAIRGGNKKVIDYYNANILYTTTNNAHSFIDEYQSKMQSDCFWVPGGAHMRCAVGAYKEVAEHIINKMSGMSIIPDVIFVPVGTGTTYAGLFVEFTGRQIPVIGITVARSVERCIQEISDLLNKYNLNSNWKEKIKVIDNVNVAYGHKIDDVATIKELACRDGIILDPIYNAKAFYGMTKYMKDKGFKNVVYINTGGIPNVFSDL